MKKLVIVAVAVFSFFSSFAQEETKPSLKVTGYLEAYYVYDFNRPSNSTRPGFIYSYNRANEVNLNLGFVKLAYTDQKLRANLAVMAGTYANANLASEPGVLKNIFEANAGVKISKTRNLWVDAGIFGSHIGFESAIGKDCWNLTRSMLADNTPYYESGAKISYTTNTEKWFISAMVLNGWQRIQRSPENTLPSFGTQVTFKPSAAVTLNSSTFVGTDSPDSARLMRYFHNFYGIFQLTPKFGVTAGFDYGIQQKSPGSSEYNTWSSPVIIARYQISEKLTVAARGEYYEDANGVIISTSTANGFKTVGYSANLDVKLSENAVWRIEARSLKSKDAVFTKETQVVKNNTFVSTSLAISF